MRLVFYLGRSFEAWNPETVAEKGAGGSEMMAVELARRLAARGHSVRVYADCEGLAGTFADVEWRPYRAIDVEVPPADVLLAWRTPWALDRHASGVRATVFVAHDAHYDDAITEARAVAADRFFVLSDWHRDFFAAKYPFIPREKLHLTRNGVDPARFAALDGTVDRVPHRALYTSSPDRGLELAVAAMPRVRARVPDAELHVYYGFLTLTARARDRRDEGLVARIVWWRRLLAESCSDGVVFHDRVGPDALAAAMTGAGVWAYPCTFYETSCVSAMEAQAAGLHVVTTALGALPETAAGTVLLPPPGDEVDGFLDGFAAAVCRAMEAGDAAGDAGRRAEAARVARRRFDLDAVAAEWEAAFLDLLAAKGGGETSPGEKMGAGMRRPAEPAAGGGDGVCLTMIVKNEASILAANLRAVRPLVDRWCVVDTGSTDGTQELVRREMADFPGALFERPWASFGDNRKEAMDLAARSSGARWLLLLDADFAVETRMDYADLLRAVDEQPAERYAVDCRLGDIVYDKVFLVRAGLPWTFDLPTHEALRCDVPHRSGRLAGVTIREGTDSARRRRGRKFSEDVEMLERYLAENPDSPHRPRAIFYLAQSLRDAGVNDRAIARYEERAALGGWDEECFYSLLQIGVLLERTGAEPHVVESAYLRAHLFRPSRAEAMNALANYHCRDARWSRAEACARVAAAIPRPPDILFVDQSVYDWRAADNLAISAYWVGKRAEARALNERLLAGAGLPAGERLRIERNLAYCVDVAPAPVSLVEERPVRSAAGRGSGPILATHPAAHRDAPGDPEDGQWAATLTFEAYGRRIAVRGSSRDLLEEATHRLPPGWTLVGPSRVERVYSLARGPSQAAGSESRLWVDGTELFHVTSLSRVLDVLESDVRHYVAEMARDRLFVHAGVVGWRGGAVLLPGRSWTGKTTLVAELVRAGATYYSDEFAVLDGHGRTHPYSCPLGLRIANGRWRRVAIGSLGVAAGTAPLPVRLVVLTSYRRAGRWDPRRLSPGQGVLNVLAHTIAARRTPAVALSILSRALQGAAILESERPEAAAVVEAILALCPSAPDEPAHKEGSA